MKQKGYIVLMNSSECELDRKDFDCKEADLSAKVQEWLNEVVLNVGDTIVIEGA